MITQSPRSILSLVCTAGAVAAVALAGIALAPSPASAAPPVIYDLGTLGGTNSYGNAVSDSGQGAGDSQIPGDSTHHAFRSDGTPGAGGVMRDLGTLGGGTHSEGLAISDAGQVAGNSGDHAFRYDGTPGSGGVMRDLGTLGGTFSGALGINNAG